MPGRDACAGSPCHNGGICKIIIQGEIQACFINIIKNFSKSKIMLKLHKNFECSCADGFKGDVCQFKTEQDHLLFIHEKTPLVFNADGRLIEENAVLDDQVSVYGSCSTMLNGEAIIFGGRNSNFERQV